MSPSSSVATERALPAWTQALGAEHRLGRILRLGLGGFVVAAILLSGIPLCPTARTLHMPCPGCGLTRATLAMLQGHFAEAWAYHPMSFVISPLVIGSAIYFALRYVRVGAIWERRHPGWIIAALLALQVALVALWIARFFGAFGGPVPI
jgi:hypothetical protein